MLVTTTTVVCEQCRELLDVVTGRVETGFAPIALRCGKRGKHQVRRWVFPDCCPRCGAAMDEDPDGAVMLWD